jgi:hypothetical protein
MNLDQNKTNAIAFYKMAYEGDLCRCPTRNCIYDLSIRNIKKSNR